MSYNGLFTLEQLERLPLIVAHTVLANMEREIEQTVADYADTTAMPGEGYREKWDRVRDPDDVQRLFCVDQHVRSEYVALAKLCRRREAAEIASLCGGRAA